MSSGVAEKDLTFAPAPGEVFAAHYRVERVLGRGGMGVVIAATDMRTDRAVAIKLLRAAEEARAVERFFREARAMSRLSTDHVVRIFEDGTAEGRPFLVMERLDGKDFAEQARGGTKLRVREVADAVVQACEALAHAHAAGIIHRDLKPSNLFLHEGAGTGPVVKLLDFGISKVKSKEAWEKTLTATNDGGVLGSPPYMSPEQVRDPKKVDARSDVWALGIVMYKLLAGRLPFDGDSVGEVFARVLERPYPPLRTWGAVDVPPEIDAIVSKCLAKNRSSRWQHTGELALALAPFASPRWRELALRTAQRSKDEPPTMEDTRGGSDAGAEAGPPSEPRTLTLDDEDPGVFAPPPTPAVPVEVTPPEIAPRVMAAPSRVPARTATAAAVAGTVAVVVALVVALGVLVGRPPRKTSQAGDPPTPPPSPASASAAPPASVAPPAVAVAPTVSASARLGAGARKPPTTWGKAAAVAPAPAAATASARPELHPNPYGTAGAGP
jgi:serine/threonine-protein kinase